MNVGVRPLYVVATLAMFPALVTLIPIASPTLRVGQGLLATFAISWAIVVACLTVEWRRDPYPVAMFGTVFTFLVAFVAGSLTVLDDDPRVNVHGGLVAMIALALLLACIVVIVRERGRSDEVPDHLLRRLGPGALFETEGVVWGATTQITGGELLGMVTIFVQSNVGAARTVRVELQDVAGLWDRRGALSSGTVAPFELPGGGLACCCIPVAPGRRPAERAWLYMHVRAGGPPGRRVRKHRGRAATRRTTIAFRLFAILGGHLVWGGGVRAVLDNPERRTGELPPPSPTWRTLVAEDLDAASGSFAQHASLGAEAVP